MSAPSSPSLPAGLLGRVFRYIDRHQDEFVQVGRAAQGSWQGAAFGVYVNGSLLGQVGFFLDHLIPHKMPATPHQIMIVSISWRLVGEPSQPFLPKGRSVRFQPIRCRDGRPLSSPLL